jgi:hypothetical protein
MVAVQQTPAAALRTDPRHPSKHVDSAHAGASAPIPATSSRCKIVAAYA